MTADVELLPLPEPDLGMPGQVAFIRSDESLLAWGRANVEHHTAAQAAEIEALRAQLATAYRVKAECNDEANRQRARAERLEEVVKAKARDWASDIDHSDGDRMMAGWNGALEKCSNELEDLLRGQEEGKA